MLKQYESKHGTGASAADEKAAKRARILGIRK